MTPGIQSSSSVAPGPREGGTEPVQDCPYRTESTGSTRKRKKKRTGSRGKRAIPVQIQDFDRSRLASIAMITAKREGRCRETYRIIQNDDGTNVRQLAYVFAVSARTVRRSRPPRINTNHVRTNSEPNPIQNTVDGEETPTLETDDYEFDDSEYRMYNSIYHFDFDGAASEINKKCRDYASKDQPFQSLQDNQIRGKTIWLVPPVEKAEEILTKFETVRKQYPEDTRAMIILPKLATPGNNYSDIVSKYLRIHTYPRGTYLFSTYNPETLEKESAPPVPCDYEVYLADSMVEVRQEQSAHDIEAKRDEKSHEEKTPIRRAKPHQPRYESRINTITDSSISEDLLIFKTRINSTESKPPEDCLIMIDSGATIDFVSDQWVRDKKIKTHRLESALRVKLADGSQSIAKYGAWLEFRIGDTPVLREFVVTKLQNSEYQAILGYSWLKSANPIIDWSTGTVRLRDTESIATATVRARKPDIKVLSASQFARLLKKGEKRAKSNIKDLTESADETRTRFYLSTLKLLEPNAPYGLEPDMRTGTLSSVQGYEDTADINKKLDECVRSDLGEDYDKKLRKIINTYKSVCEPLKGLPPSRPGFDFEVDFRGDKPPSARVYRMSSIELEELRKQLDEYISRGWLRPSSSHFSSGVLFAKKGGSNQLRLCVDFRHLNKHTQFSRYALPNIDTLLDSLGQSRVYTALDLQSGFHQLRVAEDSIHKLAFTTTYGSFEWCVMPFGVSGAPSHFQKWINHVLQPIKRPFLAVYLDDIIIFSRNEEEHLKHLSEVISILAENQCYIRLEKCQFAKTTLDYLGFTVQGATDTTPSGIKPSDKKLKAVRDWPVPTSVREIQQWLGFCNFYRRFIPSYAVIAQPLYAQTAKDNKFKWTPECQAAFHKLKHRLITAPMLVTPKTGPDSTFVLSTDASTFAIGAVLLQQQADGSLKPCSYFAKTLNKAQRNYPIYDLELFAIAAALKEYRVYLEGCKSFQVITDHRPLVHLPDQAKIRRRHVPWIEFLSEYMGYMTIIYRKGEENDADPLSRRPDLQELTEEFIGNNPQLKKKFEEYDAGTYEKEFESLRASISNLEHSICTDTYLSSELESYEDYELDRDVGELQAMLSGMVHLQMDETLLQSVRDSYEKDKHFNGSSLPAGVVRDDSGLYWIADKIYIPNNSSIRNQIISAFHEGSGHPDKHKTEANILKSFYWPSIKKDVKSFIKFCKVCQRIKAPTHKKHGSLMPLPVPMRPWESVSLDFIIGLPEVDGYDAILTVVCTLTKMAHFIPTTSNINAKQLARLFMSNVYRLHGLPRYLIGDRDSLYTSEFFTGLMRQLRTKMCLSTAYHPQTDGNTERCHRTIEQILRAYVHDNHYDWYDNLPLAEFSYNNNTHSSTAHSPFVANYGYDPHTPMNLIEPPKNTEQPEILEKLFSIHSLIIEQLKIAKAIQKHYADKRSKDHEYEVGDYVLLSTQNLKLLNQPSKKFKTRFIGPYRVSKKISSQAYGLDLPSTMRVHPVFHISLLKDYHSDTPAQDEPDKVPASNDYVYGGDYYHVQKIVNHKIAPYPQLYRKGSAMLFKVRWEGYGPKDDTWEPYVHLKRTDEFHSYLKNNAKFRLLINSDQYRQLSKYYPSRFPKVLRDTL